MKKNKRRDLVYNMYGGKCAYTGQPLDDKWNIDHVIPQCSVWWGCPELLKEDGIYYSCNDAENMVPCLAIINHYKRSLDLEGFRKYISTLHIRLAKLPKKTSRPQTQRRIEYLNKVALLFGVTVDKPWSGVFYFETLPPYTF